MDPWDGAKRLLIAFFSSSDVAVYADGSEVVLSIRGTECELTRSQAVELGAAVGEAASRRCEFVHTAGHHREDGSYAVSRRRADSSGNAKVFDSFEALVDLYDRLPTEFGPEDVARAGISGSRRHLVVRHVGEHPSFDCSIASESPLRVQKDPG